MPVQAVDERLDGWFVQMPEIRGRLPRLLAQHECLRVDEAEGVDDDFALDGLDGVDDDGDGARGQLFEGLLRVDVDAGEPAAEAGVRVVPADDGFLSVEWSGLVTSFIAGCAGAGRKGGYRFVCRSMSIILVWKTGSTASTETPVPL